MVEVSFSRDESQHSNFTTTFSNTEVSSGPGKHRPEQRSRSTSTREEISQVTEAEEEEEEEEYKGIQRRTKQ